MGSIENARVDEWGQKSVSNAQKELDQLNAQIAEVGVDAALTACSSVPGAGIVCDFTSLGKSLYQGDWLGAALDLVGFVPLVGDAIKGSTRGAKVLKTMDDLTGALSVAQAVVNKSRRILSQGTDAIRAAARSSGDFLGIRKAAARDYWSKQVRDSDAYKRYRKQIEDCPDAACKAKARNEYEQNRYKNVPKTGGKWAEGTPGNGKWVPDEGTDLAEALKQYPGQNGVVFRNGHPDFSPFVKQGPDGMPANVEIQNMQGNHTEGRRTGNVGDYGQARQGMADRNGGRWTEKMEDGYTWHHSDDGTTMQLIDSDIHGNVPHQGGATMMRDAETF